MITPELLRKIMPYARGRADLFAPHLEAARVRWISDDADEVAHWLAQVAHESGQLRYVQEIASGDAYEGRLDLGNIEPGDGVRFKGRGLIQLTGRANYIEYGRESGLDVITDPELLEQPGPAADVAGWYWSSRGLGELVRAKDAVRAITRRVNGGINGLAQRRLYYSAAHAALFQEGVA